MDEPSIARALGLAASGRREEARALLDEMLTRTPDDPKLRVVLAKLALDDGDGPAAEAHVRAALARHPEVAHAWSTLAIALTIQQRLDEAEACASRALDLAPDSIAIRRAFVALALQMGDSAKAIAACRAGLDRHPQDVGLKCSLADALIATGDISAASALLLPMADAATATPEVRLGLGALCVAQGRSEEAIRHLRSAIEGGLDVARAWDYLGIAYRNLRRTEEAADAFDHALRLDPRSSPALSNLVLALRGACRWDEAEARERQWLAGLDDPNSDPRRVPFVALSLAATAEQQLRIARQWSAHTLPVAAAPTIAGTRGTKLRVGYLSADFHAHATLFLMAGLFDRHDRSRFETFAYSYGPDDGSAIRRRAQRAFAHWIEVGATSDEACARRMRADGIDILVDLKGFTQDGRLAIAAHRPAAVQIHYLGYPGTLGFDGIDYLVADSEVIPAGSEGCYHERIVRLPCCYQVNDDLRAIPPAVSRQSCGLPDGALVLACLNQPYKLTRRFFEVWCEAMREQPDAVLWLYQSSATAQARLRAEAARQGVGGERLIFAPHTTNEAHLSRLACADLALDVLPYGSHTTGSDALWAGVPLLTCRGETFAGRVGASLLGAVGLRELVTNSLDEYRSLLLTLSRDRERLVEFKEYLVTGRPRLHLFDTEAFTREWERMLESLMQGP